MGKLTFDKLVLIQNLFEREIGNYNYSIQVMNKLNYIYNIEDSLLLLVSFVPDYFALYNSAEEYLQEHDSNRYLDGEYDGNNYCSFKVEEITPNQIDFKFNGTKFASKVEEYLCIEYLRLDISYVRFAGYKRKYWCTDIETTAEYVNRKLPQLQLRERYDLWEGVGYNFIIFEFIQSDGIAHYAVTYTTRFVHTMVNEICKSYISKGHFSTEQTRSTCFESALRSWKRMPRQKRLDEHLSYFSFRKYFREKDDVWRYADKLLQSAYSGEFNNIEKTPYQKPKNRWISEEQVYILSKKIFGARNVIYQHRPFFLKSSVGGQMSYDIFIVGLNVAIEYQGEQHFRPIDFFGGTESFITRQNRDKEKKELSQLHGINLVYINYWEEITPELIRTKVNEAIHSSPTENSQGSR